MKHPEQLNDVGITESYLRKMAKREGVSYKKAVMKYKIQKKCTFGWGDLRKQNKSNGTYTGEYQEYFLKTKEEALSECNGLNEFLGGGFRVVPITTRSDHNLYE